MRGLALAAILLVVLALVELDVQRSLSLTCDEVCDLAAGVDDLERGRMEMFLERPALPRRLAGGALYLLGVRSGAAGGALRDAAVPSYGLQYVWAERLLYEDNATFAFAGERPGPDSLVRAARLPFLALALLLGTTAYAWGRHRFGPRGGLLALLLCTTFPDLLGHGAVAVQDGSFAALALACGYALDRTATSGGARWVIALGACVGLALGAKLTASFALVALVLAALLAVARATDPASASVAHPCGQGSRARPAVLAALVVAAVAVLVLALLDLGANPIATHARALATISSIHRPLENGSRGTYFLHALLLKAPPGTLALGAVAVVVAWRERRFRAVAAREAILHLPALAILGAISALAEPHGARYVLAAVPFLLVSIARIARWATTPARVAVVALAVAANAVTVARVHPFPASATNLLAGPPELAYRALNDSNQDWGGGYKALAAWQRARGIERVTVIPFGANASIEVSRGQARIVYTLLPWLSHPDASGVAGDVARLDALFAPEPGRVYAVSAMAVHRALDLERELVARVGGPRLVLGRSELPSELVGGGLLIFDRRPSGGASAPPRTPPR